MVSVSGWWFGVEELWNLKPDSLLMVVWCKCLDGVWDPFQRFSSVEHLHLFIGKVSGWFWGEFVEVLAESLSVHILWKISLILQLQVITRLL